MKPQLTERRRSTARCRRPWIGFVSLALVSLTGCSTTIMPGSVRFSGYGDEFETKRENMHVSGVAVLPPIVEVVEKGLAGAQSLPDEEVELSERLRLALQSVLEEGNVRLQSPVLSDEVLAATPELALNLTRARRSFSAACDSLHGRPGGRGHAVSVAVDPEIGEFADLAGTDYLILARGTATRESGGVRAVDAIADLAIAWFTEDFSHEQEETDRLSLELGIVEASSGELVWYARTRNELALDLTSDASLASACRSLLADLMVPFRGPVGDEGAIGLSVKCSEPSSFTSVMPNTIFFVRLDGEEESLIGAPRLVSNAAEGGHVYLLNAEPGRYAAIGCHYRTHDDGKKYVAQPDGSFAWEDGPDTVTDVFGVFSGELSRATIVTVEPRSFVFMGEYDVSFTRHLDRNDAEQQHFSELLAPGGATGFWDFFGGVTDIVRIHGGKLGEKRCDPVTEAEYLSRAIGHFNGSDWADVIDERVNDLGPVETTTIVAADR